jgi:uncharacterized protein YukE
MEELLKKILESEVLTEETKNEIREGFDALRKQVIEETKAETEAQVRTELAEKFVADKAALVEALDTKAEEFLKSEISELKESIDAFRDLEAEYAAKLVEEKNKLAEQLKADMNELVETIDSFLEMRLTEEMAELKESIDEVRKIEFGRAIYEAYAEQFRKQHLKTDEHYAALNEAKEELEKTKKELITTKADLEKTKREKKMTQVLESLQGRPREIMEAILASVPTEKLEEAYKTFIPRVLNESVAKVEEVKSEKESASAPVLAENADASTVTVKGVVRDGNSPEQKLEESVKPASPKSNPDSVERLRRLAGLQ